VYLQNHQPLMSYWDMLHRIQYALNADDSKFADLMGLTSRQFISLKKKQQPPKITAIASLLNEIHLSMDRFLDRSIDFTVIKGNFQHKPETIPERYIPASFSRRRTAHAILSYIQNNYGVPQLLDCLKYFQIRESLFENPDNLVNALLTSDLCDYLLKRVRSEKIIYDVGRLSHMIKANSIFKQLLGAHCSPSEAYEKILLEFTHYFDRNSIYKIRSLTKTECKIVIRPNPEAVELLKTPIPWSRSACIYRMGVISSFPGFLGLPLATAHEEACIHWGDSECLYSLQYEKAVGLFKSKGLSSDLL